MTIKSSSGIRALLLLASLAIAGLIAALAVTMVAWGLLIENRAFHCTDDCGFGEFFLDIETHRQAGDTLFPAWSWTRLKIVRSLYLIAFFTIWSLSIAAPVWGIIRSGIRRRVTVT